jgi:hypothetical protein
MFVLGGGALAASIILAVMFAPVERFESTVTVAGKPLAIEERSCVKPVHMPRPQDTRPQWDSVDQHWGEAQWMLTAG